MSLHSVARGSFAGQRVVPDLQPVGRAVGQALIPQAEPAKVLLDLRLPGSLLKDLEPVLAGQGYAVAERIQAEPYNPVEKRKLTVVADDGVQRTLIHVPKWILEDPQAGNMSAVSSLAFAFERGTTLFLFSEDLDAAARSFRNIMQVGWQQLGITVEFVPWSDVVEFRRMDGSRQAEFLRDVLRLPDRSRSQVAQVGVLTGGQKERLCQILAKAFVHDTLNQTLDIKLGKKLDNIAKPGPFERVVYDLVDAAEMEGWTHKLVLAVREARPTSADLLALAQELGLATFDRQAKG